jgi:hypothetical protein
MTGVFSGVGGSIRVIRKNHAQPEINQVRKVHNFRSESVYRLSGEAQVLDCLSLETFQWDMVVSIRKLFAGRVA